MDFLRAHIVQFDFDAGRVSFLKTGEGVSGEKVQVEFNRLGLPTVLMSVSGLTPRPFLVDTGFVAGIEMGTLSTRTFDRLAESNKLSVHPGKSRYLTLNGPIEGRTGESIDQVLHHFQHVAPVYKEGEVDSVGLGFLSRFKITFDFIGNVLYMEPGRRFAATCPANRLGIDFVMDDGVPVFRDVVEGDLAWRSGIRNGDRLLRINGKLSREMSIADIGYFISSPAPGELRLGIVSPPAESEREVVIANASAKASDDVTNDTAP